MVVTRGADLPDDALDQLVLDYDYRSGGPQLDADAAALRRRRTELTGLADEVEERTRELGSRGVGAGLPLRDVAVLLGVSHQRVAQVARRKGSPATDQRGAVSAATSAVIPK